MLELGLWCAVDIIAFSEAWSFIPSSMSFCCVMLSKAVIFLCIPVPLAFSRQHVPAAYKRSLFTSFIFLHRKLTTPGTWCEACDGHPDQRPALVFTSCSSFALLMQRKVLCSYVFPPLQMVFAFTAFSAAICLVISAF